MIPVILFVYNRTDHLSRTLSCLKENTIPKLYIYSDAAKTQDGEQKVSAVRKMIGEIDWCETIITERQTNLGLGKSIRAGVTEVLEKEGSAIIFEDDMVCVPGTYQYLCAAMEHYKDDLKVMSVTGWTHPAITPMRTSIPYFDGRAECWVWGTWNRAWTGINNHTALSLIEQCKKEEIDPEKYGYDLPEMAEIEERKNIWAVRFLYWHIINKGLCMRPPWSMVDHIGFDSEGTNVKGDLWTKCLPLQPAPLIPSVWPKPIEDHRCAELHKKASGKKAGRVRKFVRRLWD